MGFKSTIIQPFYQDGSTRLRFPSTGRLTLESGV